MELDPVILVDINKRGTLITRAADKSLEKSVSLNASAVAQDAEIESLKELVASIGSGDTPAPISEPSDVIKTLLDKIAETSRLAEVMSEVYGRPMNTYKTIASADPVVIDSSGTWLKSGVVIEDGGNYPNAFKGYTNVNGHPLEWMRVDSSESIYTLDNNYLYAFKVDADSNMLITTIDVNTGETILDNQQLTGDTSKAGDVTQTNVTGMVYAHGRLEVHLKRHRYEIDIDTLTMTYMTGRPLGKFEYFTEHPQGILAICPEESNVQLLDTDFITVVNFDGKDTNIVDFTGNELYILGDEYIDDGGKIYDQSMAVVPWTDIIDDVKTASKVYSYNGLILRDGWGSLGVRMVACGTSRRYQSDDMPLYTRIN